MTISFFSSGNETKPQELQEEGDRAIFAFYYVACLLRPIINGVKEVCSGNKEE